MCYNAHMTIQLTEEQQRQLQKAKEKTADVVDTAGQRRYVLVPADVYDALRDENDQAALRQDALQSLASRVGEED